MNKSIRNAKVKVVNPTSGLPTEQLIADTLRNRNDITKDRSFLRCHIQDWERFAKVCDEHFGADVLRFIAMLLAEVLDEVGTSDGQLCHSDNDDFTIIDLPAVLPRIRERLQQRLTPETLAQDPGYVSIVRKYIDSDKIPMPLKLVTSTISANDFFRTEDR